MKHLLILGLFLMSNSALAEGFLYRCGHQVCSYSDGCTTNYNYLWINGKKISYWLDFKNDGTLADIDNVKPDNVSTGTITKQLENGNYLATGNRLLSVSDNKVYVKPFGWLYREVEVYKSLLSGNQYGRFIVTTHVHDKRYNDQNRESSPIIEENRCIRLK